MATGLKYAEDYLVGGPARARVTPDFLLSEYLRPDGRVLVHRELVAAVQRVRDALGTGVTIDGFAPRGGLGAGLDGRFLWLKAADVPALGAAAQRAMTDGWLATVAVQDRRVYVDMPDPRALPPLAPERALDLAIEVTAAFETSGDPYQQVTGNFDGAGLSFGPLQVNFASGTLPVLFRRFAARDARRLHDAFGTLHEEWSRVLALRSRAQQVAWADRLSRGPGKAAFDPAWTRALRAVGREPAFRNEMLRYAYDTYGRKLVVALAWLKGVRPVPIRNFRCLAALYDLCVQQGSLDKAHTAIRRRIERDDPRDEFALTRIVVEERGRAALPKWRADCISRRLCILERTPVRVEQDGQRAQRDNPRLHLLRNAPVNQMERWLA